MNEFYGLQAGFGPPIGLETLHELKRRSWEIVRLGVDHDYPRVDDLRESIVQVHRAGLLPLVTVDNPRQMFWTPPGTSIELCNEPMYNWTLANYREALSEATAVARYRKHPLWVGCIPNTNKEHLAWLAEIIHVVDASVGISIHRYPQDNDDWPSTPRGDWRSRIEEVCALRKVIGERRFAVTECGRHTARMPRTWFRRRSLTDARVVRYAAWEFEFWRARGAEFVCWYQLNDGPSDYFLDRYGIRRVNGEWKPVSLVPEKR